jgi:hypothetical protein
MLAHDCKKNVMVTSGASSGLVLISCMVFPPGSTVFVEDPTYFIALNMLKHDFDMNVVAGRCILFGLFMCIRPFQFLLMRMA